MVEGTALPAELEEAIARMPAHRQAILRAMPLDELMQVWQLVGHFGDEAAQHFKQSGVMLAEGGSDVVDFSARHFNIRETKRPIVFYDPQPQILRYMFWPGHEFPFQNYMWSTIKKSGKSTVAALVARWVAETFGPYQEVYAVANDEEQARGITYEMISNSIKFTAGWDERAATLPGRWRIIQRQMTHLPSGSIVKALSGDYGGQAGSNPTATFWTELWAYRSEASMRLFEELTPVPTRPHSFRWVETYAGFVGESDLLWELWQRAKNGRRVTNDELVRITGKPWYRDGEDIPIWVNERNRICAYIDEGEAARRYWWQTPEYYRSQAADLRDSAYRRLHLNEWVSAEGEFVPESWWLACRDDEVERHEKLPAKAVLIGLDAAVSGDCCAIVVVSRDPRNPAQFVVRYAEKFEPPVGGKFNYGETIEPRLKELVKRYNVVQIAYDEYQLHDMSTRLGRTEEQIAWWKPFPQGTARLMADYGLYTLIRDRRVRCPQPWLDVILEHLRNANAIQNTKEDTKLRIVKKGKQLHIDLVVALSMACAECARLDM